VARRSKICEQNFSVFLFEVINMQEKGAENKLILKWISGIWVVRIGNGSNDSGFWSKTDFVEVWTLLTQLPKISWMLFLTIYKCFLQFILNNNSIQFNSLLFMC
jgi:hypothetical protein